MNKYDGVNHRSGNEQKAYIGDMVHVSYIGKIVRIAKIDDEVVYYVEANGSNKFLPRESRVLAKDIEIVQNEPIDFLKESR